MELFRIAFRQKFSTYRQKVDDIEQARERANSLEGDKRASMMKFYEGMAANLLSDLTNDRGTLATYTAKYPDVFPEGTIGKMDAFIEEIKTILDQCSKSMACSA